MSYEYLKGMGFDVSATMAAPALATGGKAVAPLTFTGQATVAYKAPVTTTPSLTFTGQAFAYKAPATTTPTTTGFLVAAPFGAPAVSPAALTPNITFQAFAFEPKVPGGSVKTDPSERVKLKYWVKMTLGETSAFYLEKLKTDSAFTYMNANVLARFRNAGLVVYDMLRGLPDPNITVADKDAIKNWWNKCHHATWYYFKYTQNYDPSTAWRKDEMWVPVKIATAYKSTYKATGACPTSAATKTLFEYLSQVNATALLATEKTRQEAEAKAIYDAALKKAADAQTLANTAIADANKLRQEASNANQQVVNLQTNIDTMQGTIQQLGQQLSIAASPDVVASLQAQIKTLADQLAAAQAQAPAFEAQAQAAAAVAQEAAQQAEQVTAVAEQAASEVEPWYLKYKWFLLAGAAVVAGGAYLFMSKRPGAVTAMVKNWLPEPTSPRRPSGLRGNPDESDSGRPPRNAPKIIWNLFLNMARSARENGGNSPDASIYWSHRGKQWSIGDNFDRYGHFIVKPTGSGEYSIIYRGEWGDEPISLKHAMTQARRFFEEGGAADAFRCTMGG